MMQDVPFFIAIPFILVLLKIVVTFSPETNYVGEKSRLLKDLEEKKE